MECFAGLAAGGFAAKEAYMYNRENFLYDRSLRRRKEFQVQNFRVAQAELWRRDVRDLISLTEYKMHVYLLVNVLLLGITVALWCQGKLPHSTPVWLMTGNALAMAGAFSFILLSIWMAMHAAVSAQSFEARLLTQMVRLPIPTWKEVEACRTYASEFERLETKQLFRIPFVMGKQEGLVPPDPEPASGASASHDDDESPSTASRRFMEEAHVDPWGLESTGAKLPELGSRMGHGMHKYRHVKLARQAMAFWQSYDAFARICMSIGVNQLLNAASYFILAYYMTEAKVPSSATYGVVVLTTMAETLNRLDMSLTWWQLRLMQLFLYLGPAIATTSCWAWVEDGWELAEGLVVCAFLAHAAYLLTVNTLCHMHLEHNGAMLPVVYRSVLYLDVFGWSSQARHQRPSGADTPRTDISTAALSVRTPEQPSSDAGKPALAMVDHQNGRPQPKRPEEQNSHRDDFQHNAGAPSVGEQADHPLTGFSEFYRADGWLSTTNEIPEDAAIVTGCEHDAPISLPRQTFSCAMNLLCLAWIVAAVWFAIVIEKATFGKHHAIFHKKASFVETGGYLPRLSSLMQTNEEHLSSKELSLSVSWPHANVLPQSFACDANGTEFVISDGLALWRAGMSNSSMSFEEAPCLAGESLLDAALQCTEQREGPCNVLVLHRAGRRLSSCNAEGRDISDAWLEELRDPGAAERFGGEAPHARVEKAITLSPQSNCRGENCLLLGTSRGRLVRLTERAGKLAPLQALLDRDPHESEAWVPGSMRSLGRAHVGVLANGTRLHIHEASSGRWAGELLLSSPAEGFCAGGGYLYFMVHPESEWIYAQKERDFFMHMHLSSGFSEPLPQAELPVHGENTLNFLTAPSTANARFAHHQQLLWKKLRMAQAENPRPGSPGVAQGENPLAAAEEMSPTAEPEARRGRCEASPEETLRRRPPILLSANSRVFQNCTTEVCLNERRAVKEAKSKHPMGAMIREPLVTPRDQGLSKSFAKRAWQSVATAVKAARAMESAGREGAARRAAGTPTPKPPIPPPPTRTLVSSEAKVPVAPVAPRPKQKSQAHHQRRRLLTSQQSRSESRVADSLSLELCVPGDESWQLRR
ncbi:Uncharacterized protein SCF082_LOCUS51317 [Durusdinium trenchii]|uniref:Uncharacterized protein n=1 Tax=Durusdinium trenchii TaxID=1381693 RepID=A0ABP0SE29_9DINO